MTEASTEEFRLNKAISMDDVIGEFDRTYHLRDNSNVGA